MRDHLLTGELHLGGELRHATVLFSDLRGFTAIAERMAPGEVVATLNQYFSLMTDWVRSLRRLRRQVHGRRHAGRVRSVRRPSDDAAAAPRPTPSAARSACRSGWRRSTRSARPPGEWPLAISIGVDSGEVLAGTIGAEDRLEFTVIGDTVNVAAAPAGGRQAARRAPAGLGDGLRARRRRGAELPLVALDTVPLRGRRGAVRVYGVA